MQSNLSAFVVALLAALGAAVAIYLLVQKSLTALLNEVIRMPAGTTFYFRVFCLCLFLSAAAGVLGNAFDLKADAKFMEYVWKVAAGVSSAFSSLSLILLGFLTLITVLVVALGRRD